MDKYWIFKEENGVKKYLTDLRLPSNPARFNRSKSWAAEFSLEEAEEVIETDEELQDAKMELVYLSVYYISVDNGLFVRYIEESEDNCYETTLFENTALAFDNEDMADHTAFQNGLINYEIVERKV